MTKQATLSTIIYAELKKALNTLAKSKRMKVCYLVEYALREQLEDMFNISIYQQRVDEDSVGHDDIMK